MKRWTLMFVLLLVGGLAGVFIAGPLLHGQANAPLAVPKEMTSYRAVVKMVLHAVVSVEVRSKPVKAKQQPRQRGRRPNVDDAQVPEEFRKFFDQFGGDMQFEMPEQMPHNGMGSGVIIDPKGVILTNNHVVDGADVVEVKLQDGRKFRSKEVFTDPKSDLAIVKIDVKGTLPYLEFGDSDTMEIGDRVLAVGAPFGLTGSVTAGIISAKARDLHTNVAVPDDFLQTDAAINPGNSGGPLINLEGKVVGINTLIKSQSGGFQGVGMAIASNLAKNVVSQLEKDGKVHRGYIGVQIKTLDADVASRLGVQGDKGVLVSSIMPSTPGAKAGLQDGDVITAINGNAVGDSRDLQKVVLSAPLGKPVDLNIVRDGQPRTLKVTIEEQPADYGTVRVNNTPRKQQPKEPDAVSLDKMGVEVTDVTPQIAQQLGFKKDQKGAIVTEVDPDGAAYEAGVRRGMLITKVDKKAVASADGAKDLLNKASLDKGVLLQVQTAQGGTNFIVVKAVAGAAK
jgi:serine protease Do